MKTYIISLKRAEDRRAFCKETYKDFEFFDAIDGGETNHNLKPMKKGEVGCFLSHRKLWYNLLDSPTDDWVLVLEDDAKPIKDWKRHLEKVIETIPKQYGLVWLHSNKPDCFYRRFKNKWNGIFNEKIEDKTINDYCLDAGGRLNTTAYLIRPSMAKLLFYKLSVVIFPLDLQIHLPNIRHGLKFGASKKGIFYQTSELPSYIHRD